MKKVSLGKIRKQIDKIDNRMLKLLTERAVLAETIGQFKSEAGEEFYLPHREKNIIKKIVENNPGPLSDEAVENIYREIMHSCRSLQVRLKVAYFGPEATFTHLAAVKNFGKYTNYIPVKTITDVFQEVEKERADYGVVPIENSTEGAVYHTLDMFMEYDIKIYSELNLPVQLCLLTHAKKLSDIKKIYSHPQPLGQCRNWLETNLPKAGIVGAASTSEAAAKASKEKTSAAIASSLAAEIYDLNILARNIEDMKENVTRFLIIGKEYAKKSGDDKTSIMFSVKDRVGALHDMLVPFKKYKINMTKIESRPNKKKAWEYIFFVDFLGHVEDTVVKKALSELKKDCVIFKVLGSYPQAE